MSTYNSKVIKASHVKLVDVDDDESETSNKKVSGTAKNSSQQPSKSRLSEIDLLKREHEKHVKSAEKDSYERGISEGIRTGEEQARKESIKSIESVQKQLKEIASLRKSILEKAEKDILMLSVSIAEKILHKEVTSNQDTVQNILKAAMKNILDRENIKVRLHPEDFHYMMDKKEDFLQGFDGIKNIVFEEDGSIIRGGALIETQFGEVDARIDRQFAEVKNQLLSSIN
ncbi:MAG: FliH/SctL family protein [Syntrophus sp. (in: bacteria)]